MYEQKNICASGSQEEVVSFLDFAMLRTVDVRFLGKLCFIMALNDAYCSRLQLIYILEE